MNNLINFPSILHPIPFISTNQMIEVDRLMIEEYRINLFQMMENAGRCLAIVTRNISDYVRNGKTLVIAGSGGNGGGGITAARRLINWGFDVDILLTSDTEKFKGTIKHQLHILNNLDSNIYNQENFDQNHHYDIIIDAMIGYSIKGHLRKNIENIIDWVNIQDSITISLDVPSGINSTTGEILTKCIKADYTMTLALPKTGFKNPNSKQFIGKLLLADISVPPILYKKAFDFDIPKIFSKSDIVEVNF